MTEIEYQSFDELVTLLAESLDGIDPSALVNALKAIHPGLQLKWVESKDAYRVDWGKVMK